MLDGVLDNLFGPTVHFGAVLGGVVVHTGQVQVAVYGIHHHLL